MWVARKVAKLSRHLPIDRVGVVDAAIAPMLATEAAGRIIEVAEAKVIEADPDLHAQRVADERARRYVALSRTDEAGLRTVIARISAGDAVWVEATITRVAEILTAQHPELSQGPGPRQGVRLAGPARGPAAAAAGAHRADPAPEPDAELNAAVAFPADLLDALTDRRPVLPGTRRPVCTSTCTRRSCRARPGSPAPKEIGPVALEHLAELVAGTEITVKPVIDLNDRVRLHRV